MPRCSPGCGTQNITRSIGEPATYSVCVAPITLVITMLALLLIIAEGMSETIFGVRPKTSNSSRIATGSAERFSLSIEALVRRSRSSGVSAATGSSSSTRPKSLPSSRARCGERRSTGTIARSVVCPTSTPRSCR